MARGRHTRLRLLGLCSKRMPTTGLRRRARRAAGRRKAAPGYRPDDRLPRGDPNDASRRRCAGQKAALPAVSCRAIPVGSRHCARAGQRNPADPHHRHRQRRRDAAVSGLLEELSRTRAVVPGTDLLMVFELPRKRRNRVMAFKKARRRKT